MAKLLSIALLVLSFNGFASGTDGPTPWLGFVQGHCWLDDDPQFDAGQVDGGMVYGRTSLSLREECAYAARLRYGGNGSSFVDEVKTVTGPENAVQGDCWLDDDADFDFDQVSGGVLIGESTFDIRQECALIARQRYGANGSSGLRNTKLIVLSSGGMLQGHCWVDDDPQFDAGQVDGGMMFAYSSRSLREECAFVARNRYGANGSSSVMDIEPVKEPGTQVEGDCWIDDDVDFDFDQAFGGKLVAFDSFEVRRECAFIARERYGANGSSGVKNVRLVP